jgi:phosphatidylserine decarboxylase
MKFDDDLIDNSNGALETLVRDLSHQIISAGVLTWSQIRVGMSIGHSPDRAPYTPDMRKDDPTQAEKDAAKRRIEGSLASECEDPVPAAAVS